MQLPLVKFVKWATCSGAIATAFVTMGAAEPNAATTDAFAVPEPAILLLLGVGLSAVAFRVRPRRRP